MKYQSHVEFKAQAIAFRSLAEMLKTLDAKKENLTAWDILPVAVFMAFTIEAYVNSVGFKRISRWPHLERKPWRKKIEILHETVGAEPNWEDDPLLFAVDIFTFRDQLAHGKPQIVPGPILDSSETAVSMVMVQHIKPPIIEKLDHQWISESKQRLFNILRYIGLLHGLEDDDFSTFSWGYTKRLPENNHEA